MLFSLWKRQNKYPCLEIGMLILRWQTKFLTDVKSFDWIDENPSECCDLPHYDTINNGFDESVFKKIHFFIKVLTFCT